MEQKVVKMEKNLVEMEKVEKMEKILAILEKIIVTIPPGKGPLIYWSEHTICNCCL
jgi:hypothetical protein